MSGFDPRWSDDVRDGHERHRDGGGPAIGREVPRGGGGSGGQEREPPGSRDPRDVFVNHVDLPRGATRERVYSLRESYLLRGSESRTLATVGAFRVVPAGDLRDHDGRPLDPNRGELHHLRRQGLVDTVPSPGRDRALVVLTDRGRELLDRSRRQDLEATWQARHERYSDAREREQAPRQEFYSGIRQPTERRAAPGPPSVRSGCQRRAMAVLQALEVPQKVAAIGVPQGLSEQLQDVFRPVSARV